MRIVNIILVRKNRIQPETIEALQGAIDSGRDITMIHVDDTELDAIVPLQLTAKEIKQLADAQPKPQKPEPKPQKPKPQDDAIARALVHGEKKAAGK